MMLICKVPEITGLRVRQLSPVIDARGSFVKFQPSIELENSLDSIAFSLNPHLGTIRGLHFQIEPFAEEKLVTCVQGVVFDVAVDLRPNSKTFGKWTSFELSASNALQVYLPKGIAHGFQTLEANSIVHYTLSSPYSPEFSYAIDPFGDLEIDWPLTVNSISERDWGGISISDAGKKYADSLKNL
jgi:dTDP-4-dehydrorhamnose 3,5-epimerase